MRGLASPVQVEKRWDPNPTENQEYDWRRAVRHAEVVDLDILNEVRTRQSTIENDSTELLVKQSISHYERDEFNEARSLAEEAIATSADYSWFNRMDGAQRCAAYQALRKLASDKALKQSRAHFGRNLVDGILENYFLVMELTALFRFLEIEWPSNAVLEAIEDYLDEVMNLGTDDSSWQSLSCDSEPATADDAIFISSRVFGRTSK